MGASDVRVEKGQLQVGEVQLNSTSTSSLTVCCLGTFLTDSYCTTFTTVLAWIALRLSSSKASPLNFWTPAHHFSSDKDIDPPPHPVDLPYLPRPAPLRHKQAKPHPRLQNQDDSKTKAMPSPSSSPSPSPSPSSAPPEAEQDHDAALPMTMAASVVLENLPKDATRALETAGELGIAKGKFVYPPIHPSSQPSIHQKANQLHTSSLHYLHDHTKA